MNSQVLFDARVGYSFDMVGSNMNIYVTINNLFDKEPQDFLTGAFNSGFSTGTGLGVTGDLRGRRYVVGLSFDF